MNPATLVHLITDLDRGGTETSLYQMLSQLNPKTFHSVVISLRPPGKITRRIEKLGVPVHTLNLDRSLSPLGAASRLRSLVADMQPNLIQGWMHHGNELALRVGELAPSVWTIQHGLPDK